MGRRRLQVDERRQQLLTLGMRLFTERPYDVVSVDDIADAAGVSKGLLYHYFGSKREYFLACVQAWAARMLESIFPEGEPAGVSAVAMGLELYFDFVEEHPQAYLALLSGGFGIDEGIGAILRDSRSAVEDHILAAIGLETEVPIFRTAVHSWVGAVEMACVEYIEKGDVPRAALTDMLSASLIIHLHKASVLQPEGTPRIPRSVVEAVLG
jgi:AcrR family transcriptional regulator